MTQLENLFINFENRHHAAVSIDTELGVLDCDDNKWVRLYRKSKQAWSDCRKARKEFFEALKEIEK